MKAKVAKQPPSILNLMEIRKSSGVPEQKQNIMMKKRGKTNIKMMSYEVSIGDLTRIAQLSQ